MTLKLTCNALLAPVTLYENVAVMAMLPTGRDPDSALAGRKFPSAGLPHVGVTVPPMISANPDVPAAGSNGPVFVDRNRRPYLNYDVGCVGRAESGGDAKECC